MSMTWEVINYMKSKNCYEILQLENIAEKIVAVIIYKNVVNYICWGSSKSLPLLLQDHQMAAALMNSSSMSIN